MSYDVLLIVCLFFKKKLLTDVCKSITFFEARYQEHIESTYGTDHLSQLFLVEYVAYRYVIEEPNKSQNYGLGSALTAACHLPPVSRWSTSYAADDVGSSAGTMTSHLDESFLYWLKNLEPGVGWTSRDHEDGDGDEGRGPRQPAYLAWRWEWQATEGGGLQDDRLA